jgi:hypothetical protein
MTPNEALESVMREYADPKKRLPEAARRLCQHRGHKPAAACDECTAGRRMDVNRGGKKKAAAVLCYERGHHAKACKNCLAELTHLADGEPQALSLFGEVT